MALINKTKSPVSFGRFKRIEPNGKVPAVTFSDGELEEIEILVRNNVLQDTDGRTTKPAAKKEAPKEPKQEEKKVEAPEEEKELGKIYTDSDIPNMSKEELIEYAFTAHGLELDKKKSLKNLRKQISEAVS